MFFHSLALVGLLAAGALASAPTACAQATPTPDQAAAARARMGRGAEMLKELNLTADQQAKIEAIMLSNQSATRPAGPPTDAEREAMRTRRAEIDAKMKEVLTPEQYTKYQAMRPQRGPRPAASSN